MTGPTRQPNGITTASKTEPLGDFILPDMTKAHIYMEDFDYYTAADWIVTEVGTAVIKEVIGEACAAVTLSALLSVEKPPRLVVAVSW